MADVVDNVMVFADRLTDAEAAALLVATTPLGGLPAPEGRLVWWAPLDCDAPNPLGGALATGRRSAAAPDSLGFTRWVGALRTGAAEIAPFGLQVAGVGWDVCVGLATSATDDTAADQHAQFAAESDQRLRVR